jgi:lysophospholipase L1-like esterase
MGLDERDRIPQEASHRSRGHLDAVQSFGKRRSGGATVQDDLGSWATRYPAEAADPHCIPPGEALRLLAGAPWRRVIALGDSVAAGVSEPAEGYENLGGFDRVARTLGGTSGATYANLGRRGLTTREALDRQLAAALASEPELALIAVGGNDAFRPDFDVPAVAQDLASMTSRLRESGALVVLIGLFDLARSGLLPPDVGAAMAPRFDRLDDLTRRVALDEHAVFVDNHVHPMSADPSIFSSDLMHCNARGHAISAATLTTALAAALAPAGH